MKSAVILQGAALCKFCQEREGLKMEGSTDPESCFVCKGIMTALKPLADEIVVKLDGYQFETFLAGASVPQSILDREDELRSRLKIKGRDGIKTQINKILSKRIKQQTGKAVNYSRPDVTVLASMADRQITVTPRSLWLSGNYNKLVRGIAQRSALCDTCRGLGCAECNFRGKSVSSIQGKIAEYLIERYEAEGCNFVWLGSEDENSLVVGKGRPFFVEVVKPKKRSALATKGGKSSIPSYKSKEIQLKNLQILERKVTDVPQFEIKARVYLKRKPEGKTVDIIDLEKAREAFSKVLVNVRLSRKFRTVQRAIRDIKGKVLDNGDRIELEIQCDGGIPLKKLIVGQDGTVEPNLSSWFEAYEIDREKPFDILEVKTKPLKGSERDRARLQEEGLKSDSDILSN